MSKNVEDAHHIYRQMMEKRPEVLPEGAERRGLVGCHPGPILGPGASGTAHWDYHPVLPFVTVPFKVLPHGEGLELPARGSLQAVGFDLRAATPEGQWFQLDPMDQVVIPTGIAVAVPTGYAGLVLSRSGLAANNQVAVTNSPGLIDPDYRGEVMIILENRGSLSFRYTRGHRLAQLIFVPIPTTVMLQVEELSSTDRGEGGLGSTGVSS